MITLDILESPFYLDKFYNKKHYINGYSSGNYILANIQEVLFTSFEVFEEQGNQDGFSHFLLKNCIGGQNLNVGDYINAYIDIDEGVGLSGYLLNYDEVNKIIYLTDYQLYTDNTYPTGVYNANGFIQINKNIRLEILNKNNNEKVLIKPILKPLFVFQKSIDGFQNEFAIYSYLFEFNSICKGGQKTTINDNGGNNPLFVDYDNCQILKFEILIIENQTELERVFLLDNFISLNTANLILSDTFPFILNPQPSYLENGVATPEGQIYITKFLENNLSSQGDVFLSFISEYITELWLVIDGTDGNLLINNVDKLLVTPDDKLLTGGSVNYQAIQIVTQVGLNRIRITNTKGKTAVKLVYPNTDIAISETVEINFKDKCENNTSIRWLNINCGIDNIDINNGGDIVQEYIKSDEIETTIGEYLYLKKERNNILKCFSFISKTDKKTIYLNDMAISPKIQTFLHSLRYETNVTNNKLEPIIYSYWGDATTSEERILNNRVEFNLLTKGKKSQY